MIPQGLVAEILQILAKPQFKGEFRLSVVRRGRVVDAVSIATWNGPGCSKLELTHPSGSLGSPVQG